MKKGIIILLLYPCILLASEPKDSIRVKKIKYDSTYIRSYGNLFSASVFGSSGYNSFTITDFINKRDISYSPNQHFNMGTGFCYKWLGTSVSFNFHFMNHDDDVYGQTKSFDLQSSFYLRKFLIDGSLFNYQGFYQSNARGTYPGWEGGMPYPQRNDIIASAIGVGGYYLFNNKKYSLKASFTRTDIQKKSAGSWLLGAFFNVYSLQADSSIVPDTMMTSFVPTARMISAVNSNLGVGGGYAYTLIFKKYFYATLTLLPGISVQSISTGFEGGGTFYKGGALSYKIQTRFSCGYNHRLWYAGFAIVDDSFYFPGSTEVKMDYHYGYRKIFIGKRFRTKKQKAESKD